VFPRIPEKKADLTILDQFKPFKSLADLVNHGKPLPRTVQHQLQDIFTSSCLGMDVNRLGSDWALTFGGWCHGNFYSLAHGYQKDLNARFRQWAADIDVLEREISCLNRKLDRYRQKDHPLDTDWYRKRSKEHGCIHGKKRKLEAAAYLQAAEIIYTVIESTRPSYFFYEDLKGLSPRGKKGSFARLLTWMLTHNCSVLKLVESWCHASGIYTTFHEIDARNTSKFHVSCGGRLSRGLGQWDFAPCTRCHATVNTHENASFKLIMRGLARFLHFPLDHLPLTVNNPS